MANTEDTPTKTVVERFEDNPEPLLSLFYAGNGLLVLKDLRGIASDPALLIRISRLFGPEVENYRETITTANFFHDSIDEILVLSNLPPCSYEPPSKPEPERTQNDKLPIRYPHRRGWHTDQSYRRPPPDISLLLGLTCPPKMQGQTLYADGISAYADLDDAMKQRIANLEGVHVLRGLGRSGHEVRADAQFKPLLAHQMPQRQPLVRTHPVTGKRSLYLCDEGQMDFISGPLAGLTPGPGNEGETLLHELMAHITQPRYVYVHEWDEGDLVIHDNRNMLHAATWYDSASHARLMWRTTVMGNPGTEYDGETKSWIPAPGGKPMEGLEDLEF